MTEPIFRYRLVVVTAGQSRLRGGPRQWRWFVDPSGTDPDSETGQMLSGLGIPEDQIRVFPNQTAAWAAAADGTGVAPAVEHLVAQQLRRGELSRVEQPGCRVDACWHVTLLGRQHQSMAASSFRRYLGTPEAMHLMRSPTGRRAALAVPAPGLRHDLELRPGKTSRAKPLKQELIRILRGGAAQRKMLTVTTDDQVVSPVQRREHTVCESNPTGTAAATRGCTS